MKSEKRLMRIPVMMTTSKTDLAQTAKGFAAGATILLPKPFTTAHQQSTLRILLSTSLKAETVQTA
jgi:DNA-binding response OmpR family regulator